MCTKKIYLSFLLLAGSKPARIQHSLCLCEFQELLYISRTWIYKHLRVTNLSICQQHLWLRLLVIRSQLCLLLSCCMCSAAAATPCHANRFIPFTVSMAENRCNPHRKQTLKKRAKSFSIWIPKSLKPLCQMDLLFNLPRELQHVWSTKDVHNCKCHCACTTVLKSNSYNRSRTITHFSSQAKPVKSSWQVWKCWDSYAIQVSSNSPTAMNDSNCHPVCPVCHT